MMSNYELYIDNSPKINKINGQFIRGNIPFNKGIPMKDWMDGRKIRKVKKCLELGRKKGNARLAGANRISIVGIKDGKLYPFNSSVDAGNILKAKGIKINSRNIRAVCQGVRKKAGGYQWFYADEVEKYSHLLSINYK